MSKPLRLARVTCLISQVREIPPWPRSPHRWQPALISTWRYGSLLWQWRSAPPNRAWLWRPLQNYWLS